MTNSNIVEEIYRYVVQLPNEGVAGLTIKMLAEHFDVSRCYISRRFHDERGMTLAAFIQRRKLLLAEHLLLNEPCLTVRGLASRLGYSDCQHFIMRFRKHWGESPGRYRKLFPTCGD
ncbi:MAG: helix-turn-helix domain-containing protein [Candidatus Aminicenantes bacterium]|nr:helix-turn-helix domain-containing protein [Candidatus Aminicenantes bacterium]